MAEVSAASAVVELEPMQLVGPDGTPTAEDRYSRDLPPETLSWLYELMVVTRELDAEFVNLQRQGELALFASCRGQEAAQIGAAACLRKTDWLFPQYREIGAFLLRGITPAQMGAVWRGKWHGGLGFTEKCCAPIAIPIGTHGLHAVGAAMAAQRLGEDSVTVAFLGDGATSEGDAHEALNLAAVYKAPCVFFVQNNQWAISVPVSRQMAGPSIAHRAIGYGMPGHPGRRQRRAGLLRGDGRSRRTCPRGRGPDADRGGHVSAGPAHHLRRPHPVSVGGGGRGLAGAGPDPALPHLPAVHRGVDRTAGRAGRARSRPDCAPSCANRWSMPPTSTSPRCSTRSITTSLPTLQTSASSCSPSWRRRRDMTQIIERPPMQGDDSAEPRGPMLTAVPARCRL